VSKESNLLPPPFLGPAGASARYSIIVCVDDDDGATKFEIDLQTALPGSGGRCTLLLPLLARQPASQPASGLHHTKVIERTATHPPLSVNLHDRI